jgi:hypothetical protein
VFRFSGVNLGGWGCDPQILKLGVVHGVGVVEGVVSGLLRSKGRDENRGPSQFSNQIDATVQIHLHLIWP